MTKKWKRIAAFSSAVVMAAGTLLYFPNDTLQNIRWEISTSAEDTSAVTWTKTESDGLTWTLYEDGTLNISGTGAMKDYDYDDNSDNRSPVCDNRNITKVVIEDGVTSIGNYAFFYCTGLTSITIPDSVTSIRDSVFYSCTSLTNITIPDSVTSIGMEVFLGCTSLTSITIPNGITSIGDDMFSNCWHLTSITIPESVTSIGTDAFAGCYDLTSITIPESVTSIGNGAFQACGLTSITFPDSITSISDYMFSDCGSLTSITIPDAVTSIGTDAFQGCTGLTSIILPENVTSIGSYAFLNCWNLTSITIPDGVTRIGNSVFASCISLISITLSDSVTSIGANAFENCTKLKTISLGCGSALKKSDFGKQADLVSYTPHTLTKTEAKDVTCVEDGNKEYWTCEHCGKYFLSDDTNPETATAVEQAETILPANHKLTKMETKAPTCTEDGNKEYWTCEHCGKYFLSDDTNPKTATAVELSETVIPAIQHKNAITRDAAEPTETTPGYSGDRYCPDCDTVLEKGYTYWIEDNLTWKLYEDGTLNISGIGVMKDYSSSEGNRSPVYNNSNVKKVVIEDGVTSIGEKAFSGCKSLTSITIPDSVTSIGDYAFYFCWDLTSITIPDSVTRIGNSVFASCISLISITIPDSVTSIGDYAFYFCWDLTSITIPDSVTSIGNNAFNDCKSLTSITIPDSVTSIGNNTFYNCSSLTSITIPDSVISIGFSAFKYCSNLKTISLSCKSTLKRSDFGEQADLVSYTSHVLKKTAAKDETCTEDGNKEYWTCEHCGKYFLSDDTNPETATAVEQSETILPASHKLTKVKEEKAPTCTEDGNKEYWTCEHCGKYFLSDDTNPKTAKAVELSETVIPAIQHKNAITRGASEPDGTKPGYSGDRYCPDCDTVLEKGYTYWIEDNLTWKLYEDGTLNISGTGAMKNYNTYLSNDNRSPVDNNAKIKKVVIEKGVTSIGNYAFSRCWGLNSITIPDGVTSIGDYAFDSGINLRSITIPDSITSIGMFAFRNCWNVPSITIPDGVTSIEDSTFDSCISLTSITIPNSVTKIKNSAFHNCTGLISITIPDSVTSIGNSVFSDCNSLKTISLSCGSALKKSDFGEQANLVSYTNQHALIKTAAKAETCTEDGNKEYWTCEHCGKYFLSDDTNPETATAVEQSETILPASHKLTKVKEEKAPTCTEDGNKEYWTCEHCKKYFLSDDTDPATAKAVELSETVIPAIQHKNAITRGASEPDGTKPGYSGDRYCPDCDTVLEKGYTYWIEDNLTWKLYEDGTLNISGTGAMKDYSSSEGNRSPVYNNSNVKKVVIEDGVTSIGEKAFSGCISLISITLPGSVTSIGDYAFYSCWKLTSITIPDGVTRIGNSVFASCISLISITLSDSVTSIGANAFENCSSLTSITISDGVTSIGDYAFWNCSNLTSITLSDSVTSIGASAFSSCKRLTSITIPDSVTSIGKFAFNNCTSLKTISLSCGSALKKSDFGEQADLVSYTSHVLKKTAAKAETCTEDGNKEYWTCEHCGKYFLSDDTNPETATAVEQSETILPASHKLTKVKEEKAPTCTEDGNKEYWTCEHCGKYFLSDDTNPETAKAVELSETILPALKHKNETIRGASEPDGTKPGYSGDRYCPDCDTVLEKGYTYWIEDNLTWKLYEDGTLNISGTGAMKDYDIENNESPVFKNLNVKKIVIEDGVTNIGNYAFDCCTGLTSITIPDSVTSIGNDALQGCTNLTSITIPDSVTSIGAHAFSNCYKLISITLPSSITSIGEWVFSGCYDLTSITIPDSVTSIGDYAFFLLLSINQHHTFKQHH